MDLLLKQRLVGAAVIISLGVVIIPMLLDGSGNRIIKEIPPRPERQGISGTGFIKDQSIPSAPRRDEGAIVYSSEPIATKSKSGALAKQSADLKAKQPVAGIKAPSSKVSKSVTTQKLASWVVQVGSFTEKNKAITLRDQIRSKGFAVFMEQFKNSENNKMYRVRVGPTLSRSEAEVALRQVKQKIKLENGYVTQHP